MTNYIINWTSKITGFTGQGTHAFSNVDIINTYIKNLNKKYPYIIHKSIIAPCGTPLLEINEIVNIEEDW